MQKDKGKKVEVEPVKVVKKSEKSLENIRRAEEISPDLEVQTKKSLTALKKLDEKAKIPIEPHLAKSVSYFIGELNIQHFIVLNGILL